MASFAILHFTINQTMNNLIRLFMLVSLFSGFTAQGQQTREGRKEDNQLKKELNEKSLKMARKEAKQLAKEGWDVLPGALPLDKQIGRAHV